MQTLLTSWTYRSIDELHAHVARSIEERFTSHPRLHSTMFFNIPPQGWWTISTPPVVRPQPEQIVSPVELINGCVERHNIIEAAFSFPVGRATSPSLPPHYPVAVVATTVTSTAQRISIWNVLADEEGGILSWSPALNSSECVDISVLTDQVIQNCRWKFRRNQGQQAQRHAVE